MKSTKTFFISMILLIVLYFIFDYLKSTYFLHNHHGLFVKLKTISMVVGGIVAIYISFEINIFKLFLKIYAVVLGIYFLLRFLTFLKYKVSILANIPFETYSFLYYEKLQIFSINPFVIFSCVYWLITKVLMKQKNQQVEG